MKDSNKRQFNIKNKLIAAIAMLLVSTIMMVSATYAWFTLSTAPEIQGITTTVGANGNLEIALSPYDGDYSSISSAVGDTNKAWYNTWDGDELVVGKNYTWGNLLDLSQGYSLDEITLLPAQLNIAPGSATANPTLNDKPLKIPTYGADGRIDSLEAGKVQYGGKDNAKTPAVDGFLVSDASNGRYGVRAIGTSSTMSETALNFQNALAAVNSNKRAANTTLSNAFATYGNALASIALLHANAGSSDGENYAEYVDDLQAMVDELSKAENSVEVALYNALLALANTPEGKTLTVSNGQTVYQTIKNAQDTGLSLSTVWGQLDGEAVTLLTLTFPELTTSYQKWETANNQISATQTALSNLLGSSNVTYGQIATALSGLMNMDGITINGMSIDEAKANAGGLLNGSGINLQLGANSGVFATFGELTGNVSNIVVLGSGIEFGGFSLAGARINITTTTEPKEGALLDQVRSVIAMVGPATETGNDKSVIDVTYGYALDFVFRTNAANSSLLLQTAATQRIYGDSQNAATMGGGSTLSFDGTTQNIQTLVDMMSGVRVVFKDTKGNDVYGIAKISVNNKALTLVANLVDNDVVSNTTQDVVLNLTATAVGTTNTLTWTNQGVADTVTYTYGYDENKASGYIDFTVTGVDTTGAAIPGDVKVYRVYDQDLTLEGDLMLYSFSIDAVTGALSFTAPMDTQTICSLDQNVAKGVTALVYLDGDYIDNSDVVNSETGIANTGKLNLQFASSANLVPMNNTPLKNGVGVDLPSINGWTVAGEAMAEKNTAYSFTVTAPAGYTGPYTVSYTVGGVTQDLPYNAGGTYEIPGASITDNVTITVTPTNP